MTSQVRAEMAANVWKVLVAEGDVVSAGTELLVLESMKMEIPVLAEGPGTVTRLRPRGHGGAGGRPAARARLSGPPAGSGTRGQARPSNDRSLRP
jgi:hypothetical protein